MDAGRKERRHPATTTILEAAAELAEGQAIPEVHPAGITAEAADITITLAVGEESGEGPDIPEVEVMEGVVLEEEVIRVEEEEEVEVTRVAEEEESGADQVSVWHSPHCCCIIARKIISDCQIHIYVIGWN